MGLMLKCRIIVVFLCVMVKDTGLLVNISGKEVKITFHKFPDASRNIRLKWLHAIRRDVGMSWLCFDVEQLHFV